MKKTRMTRRTMKRRRMMVMGKMKVKMKVKDDNEKDVFCSCLNCVEFDTTCPPLQYRGPHVGGTPTAVKPATEA